MKVKKSSIGAYRASEEPEVLAVEGSNHFLGGGCGAESEKDVSTNPPERCFY